MDTALLWYLRSDILTCLCLIRTDSHHITILKREMHWAKVLLHQVFPLTWPVLVSVGVLGVSQAEQGEGHCRARLQLAAHFPLGVLLLS